MANTRNSVGRQQQQQPQQRNENLRKLFAPTTRKQNSTILQNKSISDNNLREKIETETSSNNNSSMPQPMKNEPLQRDWALSQSNGYMPAYPGGNNKGDAATGDEDNMSMAAIILPRNRRSSSQIRRWDVGGNHSSSPQQMPKSGSCLALASRAKSADIHHDYDEKVEAGNQFSMTVKNSSNQSSYGSDINLNTSIQRQQYGGQRQQQYQHHDEQQHHFTDNAYRSIGMGMVPATSGLNNNYRESCPEVHSITTPKSRRPSLQWYKRKNWLSEDGDAAAENQNNTNDEVKFGDSGHMRTRTSSVAASDQPLGGEAYNQFQWNVQQQSHQYSRELSAKTDCIVGNTIDDNNNSNNNKAGNNNYALYSANNTQQWPRVTNYIGSQGENYIRDNASNAGGVGVGPRRPRAHSYGYYSNEYLKSLDSDEDNADEADVVDGGGYYSHGNVAGQEKKIMTKAWGNRNYNDGNDDGNYNYKGYDVNENITNDKNSNNNTNRNNIQDQHDEEYDVVDDDEDEDNDYVAGDDSEFELLGSDDDDEENDDYDNVSGDDADASVIDNDTQTDDGDENLNKNQQFPFFFQQKPHTSPSQVTSTSKPSSSLAEIMKIRLKPKMSADRIENNSPTIITNFMSPITTSTSSPPPPSSSASAVAVASQHHTASSDPQSLSQHSGLIKNSCVQNNFIYQENMQKHQQQPHLMTLKEIGNSSNATAGTASRHRTMNNATSDDDNDGDGGVFGRRILLHSQTAQACQNKYTFHGSQQHLPVMPAVVASNDDGYDGDRHRRMMMTSSTTSNPINESCFISTSSEHKMQRCIETLYSL